MRTEDMGVVKVESNKYEYINEENNDQKKIDVT